MSLYKYVTAERVDILQHERIRFSQTSALNDPIETYPVFDDVGEIRAGISPSLCTSRKLHFRHHSWLPHV
jgi:hypothetical protein